MRKYILTLAASVVAISLVAQTTYYINIDKPEKEIIKGHLDLGGSNPSGDKITVNSYYIELNGKPFFPIIGEFHFSRYPAEYWEESIRKMKAGGITTIATYVFWNLHEREEGNFDWTGDLNLRRFLELVEKNGMYAIVRIGPFCHGEMRNGGMPDWIYGRKFEIRSNDPDYLSYVDKLYGEIASQMEGKLYKDGGPVIGIQLENEYLHSAAPWEFTYPGSRKEFTVADRQSSQVHEQITVTEGENPWIEYGKSHMAKLKEIAKNNGVDVPLYTATGWGNAAIVEKGSIPVTAGYVYPFWAPPALSPFYLFKDIHGQPDYSPVSYEPEKYPSISGEIGPGIQVKWSRRPIVDFKSVNPLMIRIIGSGSNGIGYYMYHGGTTPSFNGKFYNEEVNGIPRKNYDFQAPIGQYGQIRNHFKSLRMLHMFLESFDSKMGPMKTVLPETNARITPEDTTTLRYAVRSFGDAGFVFLINFQDHHEISDIRDVRIEVEGKDETFTFPFVGTMDFPAGMSGIFPFNLKLDNLILISATVQPLTILKKGNQNYYIFSSIDGIVPELKYPVKTSISKIRNAKQTSDSDGTIITGDFVNPFSFKANGDIIVVLPQEMALNSVKIGEHLYISNTLLLEGDENIEIIGREVSSFLHILPALKQNPLLDNGTLENSEPLLDYFSSYKIFVPEFQPEIQVDKISASKYLLSLQSDISNVNDVFIDVDYVGDRGMAFMKGELITDHFYHNRKWEISLKKSGFNTQGDEMLMIFHPMYSDYEYIGDLQEKIDFNNGKYLEIRDFKVIPEYKTLMTVD
jgi:beta-galactosidase